MIERTVAHQKVMTLRGMPYFCRLITMPSPSTHLTNPAPENCNRNRCARPRSTKLYTLMTPECKAARHLEQQDTVSRQGDKLHVFAVSHGYDRM